MSKYFINGEEISVIKNIESLKNNDFVIFESFGRQFLKQIKGCPTDVFQIIDNKLIINNEYVVDVNEDSVLKDFEIQFFGILPENSYIVLGTESDSIDSRKFGPIMKNCIIGKVKQKNDNKSRKREKNKE